MRRNVIAFLLGVSLGVFVSNINPLWKYQFRETPKSVPEQWVEEARVRGWL